MDLFRYFWYVFQQWVKRQPLPLRAIRVEDVPDKINQNLVYVVGNKNNPWLVVMSCPCGCKAKIHMSLIPEDYPTWQIEQYRNCTITLKPSVWRTQGCRSHFFLHKGMIDWC
jgi:hypothetical protein